MQIITNRKALRQKSTLVSADESVSLLIDNLNEAMDKTQALGLAAPQLGIFKRVIVLREHGAIVNPVIVKRSRIKPPWRESCLSMPDMVVKVRRHETVTVTGEDTLRNPVELELSGLEARVAQHEIDHLDGRLICDYIVRAKKKKRVKRKKKGKRNKGRK